MSDRTAPPGAPPRSRWARGDVGREIGNWILAELRGALLLAGIDGRAIDGSHVVGVVPVAAIPHTHPSTSVARWRYSTNHAIADPGSGSVRFDSATASAVATVALDNLTDAGVDVGGSIASLTTGDSFYFQVEADAGVWGRYTLSGPPVDHGGWFEIPVTYVSSAGSAPSNNTPLLLEVTRETGGVVGGASNLDALTDVTLTAPAAGQLLTYDAGTSQWVNAAPASPTGTAIAAREEFLPAAAATTVTLAHTPLVVLAVSRNGVAQSTASGHYSVSGAVLTFTTAFDGTDRVVVAYAYDTGVGGSATTAARLDPGRNINGVLFDGSADVTVPAAAGTLTGSTLAAGVTSSSLTSVGTLTALTVTATITGSVSGNAGTATALQTARAINGVSFNGTADITVTAAAGTLTGSTLASGVTASSLTSVGANLGVNGGVPAWGGSYRAVSVNGVNEFGGNGTASAIMTHNLYYDGTQWRYIGADTGESIQLTGQSIYFQTAPSGSAGGAATGLATRMQIAGTGAVATVQVTAHSGATNALSLGGTVTSTPLSVGGTVSSVSPAEAYGVVHQPTFSGSANAVYGIFQRFLTANSYAAAAMYGLYLGGVVPGASNSITNNYGLYVASQAATGVSTSFGVYVASGSTYGVYVQGGSYGLVVGAGGIGVDNGLPNANARVNVRLDQNTTTTINVVNASTGASAYGGVGAGSDVVNIWMLALSSTYGSPYTGKGLIQCTAVNGLMLQNTGNGAIQFWSGSGGGQMVCWVTGIGGSYPGFAPGFNNSYDLGQSGNAWRDVWCARGAFNGSHSSLKREWSPVQPADALAVARDTAVGTFRYKPTDENDVAADLLRLGLLADDAHPWLSPDGHNVSPQDTACLALAAIRALADENDSLRARLDALEARARA